MKALLKKTALTENRISPLILRITMAVVLWPHGAQLFLGLFGGRGYTGSMGYFMQQGLPYIFAFIVIFLLFFGAILLLLGLGTRIFAFGILVIFIGMVTEVHYSFGFFMNWSGNQKGEGFEYHLLVIGVAISLMITGGGKFSLDRMFNKEK